MHDITLIFTSHREIGICNSGELYKIIESINPEVIFEELPVNAFITVYKENQIPSDVLEIECLKRYLGNHNLIQIPVDIDTSANITNSDINNMFHSFLKYNVYDKLDNEQQALTAAEGFTFLNSPQSSDLISKKKKIEIGLLPFMSNKKEITKIHKLFYEEHDIRENAMLQNIYNYSAINKYDRAIFIVGAAHRKSMIERIKKYELNGSLKLNWKFYNSSLTTQHQKNFANRCFQFLISTFKLKSQSQI